MFTAGIRVVLVAGTIEVNDPIWCDFIEYVKRCYLLTKTSWSATKELKN